MCRGPFALEAVALPTRIRLEPHQAGGAWWAKQGLLVRAGAPVDLEITAEHAAEASIGWGSPGPRADRIRVFCPAGDAGQGWIAFAGGHTVHTPRCLPLRVRSGSRKTVARIPVGAPC